MATKYGNRWEVIEPLGEGGQAQVFLVRDLSSVGEETFVLKRLRNQKRLDRFAREVRSAISLEHPNLIRHVDHDLEGPKPFLVVEHCAGGTLEHLPPPTNDPLPLLGLFLQILRAVEFAHSQGVVHRDLKPQNIFLRDDGRTPVVGDFGLCYLDDENRLTTAQEAVGSRLYMAPELADGRLDLIEPTADVYSLGKILYWLFRRTVFDREKHRMTGWTLAGPTTDVPPYRLAERELIMQLLDQSVTENPDRRFSSAGQFRAVLERVIWGIERQAQPTTRDTFLTCKFCGIGEYQDLADSYRGNKQFGLDEVDRFGIGRRDGAMWLVLWCNNCGHVQQFRRDILKRGDPWRLDGDDT